MAFKKMLPQRLLRISRFTNAAVTNCCVSSPCTTALSKALNHPKPLTNLAPDPGDDGICRRYLHHHSAAAAAPELGFLPTGKKLVEKLREMDIARQRIRLDCLGPASSSPETISVKDAVKILKLSQLETVKSRLRLIEKDFVSYPEFLEICAKDCSNIDQSLEFAKMLDQSGSVIVLGNVVFLRPEQVVKAIQGLIPVPTHHSPRMKELQEMEEKKSEIDSKAKLLVQRELWCGLGYLIVQTAAFMRLTFWELSWDVMEPICFYVTSIYFMGGYGFFLRTSIEPSFEGFYQSRFGAKQKRLMKAEKFDIERYKELKKACSPYSIAAKETHIVAGSSSYLVMH
ncbi:calcium uniporter protein 2 mitochondrial [Phtheirospermum japonicum]|uniref:Calcium uniporter protein 2 mitochondrial n=1 Tax=Phtheirospermum japonicum TaxID=374723 RepID=A0A830D517_9LAMI|nr:calcium uniporter protein 2 mitochondrial [Phtheirospermum japonicum]